MAAAPPKTRRYTIDDLEDFPDDGKRRELVDGQIVEWGMPTYRHSAFLAELLSELRNYVVQHRLGRVVGGDLMVRIQESVHNARGADIAFYRRGRKPSDPDAAATRSVPDLVVEIVSPSDRADRTFEKVRDWLKAGVPMLWYVDPVRGTAVIYRGNRVTTVEPDDLLDGGEVIPGFQIKLRDLLNQIEQAEEDAPDPSAGDPVDERDAPLGP